MRNILSKDSAPTDVVSRDVTPLTVNTDASAYSRLGWLIVLLGVGGFFLWACFAPLDKGVPMSGTVTKEGSRKAVQHQIGGTIQEILVKDGDIVAKGQVLVRMNSTQASTQTETTRSQYITARTAEARLQAELAGASAPAFPPSLLPYKADPRVIAGFELQTQLFNSRRGSLNSELSAYDENIAGIKSQLAGIEESRDAKKAQLGFLKEQLDNLRDLAREGYVARTRLLDAERSYSQISGAIAEDIGNIGRYRRQIMEMGLRRQQRGQDFQKEVRTNLADVQREAESLVSRIAGQEYELGNTDVKAGVDGTIVGLAVFTPGGVVGPGAKMMEIVPSADPLVVEGQLPVNLIDRVHNGLPVDLIFSAFNTNQTPHISGVVIQVSADRAVEERTGNPYYKVRARVSPEGVKMIAQKKLDIQAGMPVEMFVKTGERTLMSYLLKPVFDRAKSSMSEE
ncbi:HlyD family type I secretion periplasmic adaptor subunit [Rugamonas rubra]|uniref:Membrane fusion protein (MFP) family protein n=1 Tax=Rugamonas rubra TaxID=758825 RepID=A0A1I4I3G3_9BURK|nr:HlyD family type I secretion periplasmic adaptor subunit [Rugamonas rubra]SFL48978.1 membrane fusion protein, protease secretion system [Rugamonas rubra]